MQFKSALFNFFDNDIILLTNTQFLEYIFIRRFNIFFLYRATTNPPNFAFFTNFGIDDLCRYFADDKNVFILVYDYRIDKSERRIRLIKINKLLLYFLSGIIVKTAFNFFDIENYIKI